MKKIGFYFFCAAVSIPALVIYCAFLYRLYSGETNSIDSSLGSLSSLSVATSMLALLGLMLSLRLQSKQILEQRRHSCTQSKQDLLAVKISALISKQEILAQFICSDKIHPEMEFHSNAGNYRDYLLACLKETENHIKEAEKLLH